MKQGSMLKFRVAGRAQIQTRLFQDAKEFTYSHGEQVRDHVSPMIARTETMLPNGDIVVKAAQPEIGRHWDWHEITPYTYE